MQALFARLRGATSFLTASRDLQVYSQVAAQPALFLVDLDEEYPGRPTGIPVEIIWHAEAWIYVNSPAPLGQAINNLLDAVDISLAPDPVFNGVSVQNTQTLGGLVEHCWIEGTIEKAFSQDQTQAIAVIPIRMLVPQ